MGFFALLGSINGAYRVTCRAGFIASVMRILLDHKSQLGFRTVENVVVFDLETVEDIIC